MTVNPLRTALSALGITIGVASVIATLALTEGLEHYTREQIASQTDVQAVVVASRTEEMRDGFAHPVRGYPIFGLSDAAELRRQLRVGEVTMVVSGQGVIGGPTATPHLSSITATLANYLIFGHREVAAGRYFSDSEAARDAPVVVLSNRLAGDLSPTGDPTTMVSRVVRLRGRLVTVLGVMPHYTGERGYQAYVPFRSAAHALGGSARLAPSLVVRAATLESVDDTKAAVEDWLGARYRDWPRRVTVTSSLARLEQARSGMLLLRLILGALAGISLVVGGVGIMNVLLASVAERTREIGIRKALGARHRDILYQFLAESLAITGIGSTVGVAIGITVALSIAALVRHLVAGADLHAAVSLASLGIALCSAASIGLAFGIYPALRAAGLSPIDAIRND